MRLPCLESVIEFSRDDQRFYNTFAVDVYNQSRIEKADLDNGRVRYSALSVPPLPDVCKGKAFLLMLLLRSQGVKAWPVLCQTRDGGVSDPDFALAGDFDHCIVAIEDASGQTRLFDPTCESVGWPALPVSLRGTWGLLVREHGGELVRLDCPGRDPRIEVKAEVDLCQPGLAVTRVRETYSNGALASVRERFQGLTDEQRRQEWQDLLAERVPNCQLKSVAWRNLFETDKDMVVEYEFESRGVLRRVVHGVRHRRGKPPQPDQGDPDPAGDGAGRALPGGAGLRRNRRGPRCPGAISGRPRRRTGGTRSSRWPGG